MNRLIAAIILSSVAAPAFAQQAPTPAAQTAKPMQAVDDAFAAFRSANPVPGMVYGVVRDGKLVHWRGGGVRTLAEGATSLPAGNEIAADTRFRIASMSKAFTALAILSLRDAGKLSLDDPADKYVPEMRGWRYATTDAPRIRVKDLLAHVGGLVTDDPWGDRQQVLSDAEFGRIIAAGVPWSRAPGMAHEYSNFGYALLGRIVSNASGKPYQRYITDTILTPLGMRDTTYDVLSVPRDKLALGSRLENGAWSAEPVMKDGAFGAMGGIVTTANDYAKWLGFLLSAWPPRDGAETGPVRRSSVREMVEGLNFARVSPRPGAAEGDRCMHAYTYGMGMRVTPDCDLGLTLSHGGGYPGYGSFVVLAPETGTAVFAFTNRTYTAPVPAVWQSLFALRKAGTIAPRAEAPGAAVVAMHDAARAAYAAGNLDPLDGKLAMNFLMDRSAANWTREFARIKGEVGACPAVEGVQANGAMTINFRWTCEKGQLDGRVLLAPTNPPTLQALNLFPRPAVAKPTQ